MYEHIKDATSHYDTQTLDAATEDQLKEQPVPNIPDEEEKGEDLKEGDEVKPLDEMEKREVGLKCLNWYQVGNGKSNEQESKTH